MSVTAIVLLVLLGFLLLFVEFLIIPGITLAGIGAVLVLGGAIFCGYYFYDLATGNLILLSTCIGMIIFFVLILKLKTWEKFGLKSKIDGKVGFIAEGQVNAGDLGLTVSRLAPMGKAMFNEQLFEVRSEGAYIDAHKEIRIIQIDGNKIYVELK